MASIAPSLTSEAPISNNAQSPTPTSTTDPTQPWRIILIDSNHTVHLYIREIGQGYYGTAQLLQRLDTGALVVRKCALQSIPLQRAARWDREARIALELRHLQSQSQSQSHLLPSTGASEQQHRFANLLSNGDIRSPHTDGEFLRESWWTYYTGGGSLATLLRWLDDNNPAARALPAYPCALVLNLVHQALTALQWMNRNHIFHLDAHAGNVFLDTDDDDDRLVSVVGDFGLARLEPPIEDAWQWHSSEFRARLPSRERRGLSSAPDMLLADDEDEPDGRPRRLPADFMMLVEELCETLLPVDEGDAALRDMHEAMGALQAVVGQERRNDRISTSESASSPAALLPEVTVSTPRPARVEITALLARLKEVEQMYLDAGGAVHNEATLAAWRAHTSTTRRVPEAFATADAAREQAVALLRWTSPFAIVDITDQASIDAGVADLAVRTGHPTSNNANPVSAEIQLEEQREFRVWFDAVFTPAVERQYTWKDAVRLAGLNWLGVTFAAETDHSRAAHVVNLVQMQALRISLQRQVLPPTELAVRYRLQMAR